MAILDEWRSQRQERQQAVRSRKQEVRSKIALLQEERLTQELHNRNLRQQSYENLQRQTQELLTASYLHRIQTKAQLDRHLTVWMEALRSDIQSYLQELESMGEARKRELHQSFGEWRERRTTEAQLMRDRQAHFQAQLQKYRQNLQFEMWGNSRTGEIATQLLSAPDRLSSSVPKKLEAGLVEPAQQNMTALQEQVVYNYIRQGKGARLTEIETATALNRVQTVDALRSLLQKGLLVQRDRVYLTLDTIKTPVAIS